MRLDSATVDRVADRQAGVVTTAQLAALGADRAWVSRQVGAGRWQRLHQGVYAAYSGPLTWLTRAWAAVLYAGPRAALSHSAAAHLLGFSSMAPRIIDVTVPADRRVKPSRGVRVHCRRGTLIVSGRPRTTGRGDTVLDLVATARSADDVVGWVSRAARAGTLPAEVLEALARRPNTRNARLLAEIVAEVEAGIESPLERRYHRDVERKHGLPRARLQVAQWVRGIWLRSDGRYDEYGVRIELDGDLGHPGGRTDRDTWRDNAVLLATGDVTLRYRWRHVAATPCETAAQVAAALRAGGWRGTVRRCGPTCSATR
jgi:hypothetical protein